MEEQFAIADLTPIREWVGKKGGSYFRSFSRWMWFYRQNRRELLRSGALIVEPGARGAMATPALDRIVIGIIQKRATERAASLDADFKAAKQRVRARP